MELIDQLIEIYGRQPLAQVPKDREYLALCEMHDDPMDPFHADRMRVEKMRRSLDEEVGIQKSSRQFQVSYALKRFMKLVGSRTGDDEICRLLIMKLYYPKWTGPQQQYFNKTCEIMRSKSDYFLSFTQRNRLALGQPPTARFPNPINSYHRYLIRIGAAIPDPLDSPDNQFALLIHQLLILERFNGFYFPDDQGDSQEVIKKLTEGIRQCLVFIQLVQNEMFDKDFEGVRNYCYDEYCEAIAAEKEQILVFANGEWPSAFIADEDVLPDLDNWRDFVRARDPLSIRSTRYSETSPEIQTGIERITKLVVSKVREQRNALWEKAPADTEK